MTSLGWQTFTDMVSEVGRIVGDSGTGRRRPIKDAMMRNYDGIAAAVEWPQLVAFDESGLRTLGTTTVKSLESGEAEAPAPFYTGKLRGIMLQGQSTPAIEIMQPGLMAELAASQFTASRRPAYAAQIGVTAQTLRLSAAGSLTAYATDSSANDGTQTVRIEYKTSGAPIGHESTATVSGSFTAGAAISGTAAAGYPISKVTLPSGWAGDFQVRDGSGAVIVNIPSNLLPATTALTESRTVSRPLYRFWPIPDQDYGLTWTWWRRPRRLLADSDTPEIPVASYLIAATAAEILRHMDKPQAALLHEREAEKFIRLLLRQNNRGPISVIPKGGNFVDMTGAAFVR
jgi:hypothetical protein